MTDTILAEFSDGIDALELVPGSGGVFEVSFDSDLVFSKARERRFPEDDEILGPLRARL
ncbi:MAG: SelT/SelW/SelH family protein [Actinobacteria bacterium]|nr:SelT/SelW/SelH family protein [Actinomycetota bacterium]